ncbi:MAG: sugar phosphate isomerase/epimerase [Armatimonadetes bacterium]|nr:sugar phosphate isomerase/epimerase [Armatimonadota bacterium]
MYANACWGAVGVGVDFVAGLDLAQRVGFGGADVPINLAVEAVAKGTVDAFTAQFAERGLELGPWGLPIRWQGGEDEFQADLANLPAQAAAAQAVGATRVCTWVPSWSDSRGWDENWQFHLDRFGPVAKVLGDHGVRLGLEFLGPKTLRDGHANGFIYTCPEMVKLCRQLGPNVGLLLDAWHWYTSGGTQADLAVLTDSDIVQVHVNDAPREVALDDQRDNVRCLPGDTLVIDLAVFMGELARLEYSGPVTVEPFNDGLRAMPDVPAAYRVKASLDFLFSLA